MICYIPSFGIRRIPHLKAFLEAFFAAPVDVKALPFGSIDAVIGWGKKQTSEAARAFAVERGLPYIAIEDGFLRSFGLGVDGVPPLSLLMDRSGIYYDATQASDLETSIAKARHSEETRARAKEAMQALRDEKLTKYNSFCLPYDGKQHFKRLIIDQTARDASVLLSGAQENAFEQMIHDALSSYDASEIAIKLHPDTIAGKKAGYLQHLSYRHGVTLINAPVDPWDLLACTDEVATISSQLGFDALMAGNKVICYGTPFYAGWGLTEDKIPAPRRKKSAQIDDIFASAYIDYARYIDPFTGAASTLENTIDLLSDSVRMRAKLPRPVQAAGFSPWKKWFLPAFAGGRKHINFTWQASGKQPVLRWASRIKDGENNSLTIRAEDGFVRSKGLGAKLVRPWSLVFDRSGIYYDPRHPSDLETILETAEMPPRLLRRAEKLRQSLISRGISKYNTGSVSAFGVEAKGKTVILVPGQVEDDASIRTGTRDINTNLDLLKTVRARYPDAYIIYKPHPDVEAGKRRGRIVGDVMRAHCDSIAENIAITALWPLIDEVHTMTSLAGFEGLLRDKKIYCYGIPFYSGWGLTQDYYKIDRRTRHLTINALVAGTLIMYPSYIDWPSGRYCTVENVIRRLSRI